MESSSEEELEGELPGHEWITPQSSIRAAYQSQTEKVLRSPLFLTSPLFRLASSVVVLWPSMSVLDFLDLEVVR
jgi:hypothetical protein